MNETAEKKFMQEYPTLCKDKIRKMINYSLFIRRFAK
jgi:hypothetical protein